MPKKTKSIEETLMDDSVSKEQVIGIMYDALSTMQRYNGHTITHCLVEAMESVLVDTSEEKETDEFSDTQTIDIQKMVMKLLCDLINTKNKQYNEIVELILGQKDHTKKDNVVRYQDIMTIIAHGSDALKKKFKKQIEIAS